MKNADTSIAWAVAVVVLMQFAVLWGYYVLFEALADGRTPGKRLQRLRVVRDGGYSVTFGASAVRNLMRIVDMQPVLMYGVGMVSVLVSKSGKRLGDMAAGTIVVKEEFVHQPVAPPPTVAGPGGGRAPHAAALRAEFDLLERFSQRQRDLDPERRASSSQRRAPARARARRVHGRNAGGAAREVVQRRARGTRSGFGVATGSPARRASATRSSRRECSAGPGSPRRSPRRSDRAAEGSARTAFANSSPSIAISPAISRGSGPRRRGEVDEVFYLNRLVAGAHNLLYRRRAITPRNRRASSL